MKDNVVDRFFYPTGKTTVAMAIVASLKGIKCYLVGIADVVDMYLGKSK